MSINMLKKPARSEAEEGVCCCRRAFEDMTHEARGQWSHPRGPGFLLLPPINPERRKFNLANIYWAFIYFRPGWGNSRGPGVGVGELTSLLPSPFGDMQREKLLDLTQDS